MLFSYFVDRPLLRRSHKLRTLARPALLGINSSLLRGVSALEAIRVSIRRRWLLDQYERSSRLHMAKDQSTSFRYDFSLPASEKPAIRRPLFLGSTAIGIFFGGFVGWASFAPLSSAATASGQVRVESHRKTVQHLEGGIISDLLVREGDFVTEGQILIRLDDTRTKATVDTLRGQHDALKALEARLVAERDGLSNVVYPMELGLRRSNPRVAEILAGQDSIFSTRSKGLVGQFEVLVQRVSQLEAEIRAHQAQAASAENQIRYTNEELEIVRDLAERGLERRPRLLSLERQLAQLEGVKGQHHELIARTQQAIGEAQLQMANLRHAQSKEVTAELRDVQTRLAELEDRLRAATDVQARTEIVAPQSGRVVRLRHFTLGGVVQSGEPLLEVVPQKDNFVIDARISSLDIDAVHPGLEAEIKLTAFKQRRMPILLGRVMSVSADALADERTGQFYYLAQVAPPSNEIPSLKDLQLYQGMPAEVLVITGQRSLLDFLIDPIRSSLRRAFRED